MLENQRKKFSVRKETPVERQVKVSPIVIDLLKSDEVPDNLSPKERVIVDRINKLKGTQFQGSPGHLLSVLNTGSYMARVLNRDFDLDLLHVVMDGKVRRNNIPVDLDNPIDVDKAWNRYFNKGS